MTQEIEPIQHFVAYARTLTGDEKGEAQVFCDRLPGTCQSPLESSPVVFRRAWRFGNSPPPEG